MAPISKNGLAALDKALSSGFVQRIENVAVLPEPQAVRAWFTTSQPTVPIVEVSNERLDARDPKQVFDVKFHLFSPPITEHAYRLGEGERRLSQGTRHILHITAPATAYLTMNPSVPTREVRFSTLLRRAVVRVNHIYVHSSGDGTSPGDLSIVLAVYDGEQGAMIGAPYTRRGSVEGRTTVPINHAFTIERAPDSLTLYAFIVDSDIPDFPVPGVGMPLPGMLSSGVEPGQSTGIAYEKPYWAGGLVTRHVNLPRDTTDSWVQQLTMSPPVGVVNYLLDFTVEVRVWHPVEDSIPGIRRTKRVKRLPSVTAGIGAVGGVFGRDGSAHHVSIGPEQSLLVQRTAPPEAEQSEDRWQSLGPVWSAPVSLVADRAGTIHALTVDENGTAQHRCWTEDAEPHPDEEWDSLGGTLIGPILAHQAADGLYLFARGRDGTLQHRVGFAQGPGQRRSAWTSLGSCPDGSLEVVGSARAGVHLFAHDHQGDVHHKSFDGKAWQPGPTSWTRLGDSGGSKLLASAGDDGDVAVVALIEDGTVRWKEWRRGRWSPRDLRWESGPSIDALLDDAAPDQQPTGQ